MEKALQSTVILMFYIVFCTKAKRKARKGFPSFNLVPCHYSEGSIFRRSKIPKVQKSEGSKVRRFKSQKVQKSEGSKVRRFKSQKITEEIWPGQKKTQIQKVYFGQHFILLHDFSRNVIYGNYFIFSQKVLGDMVALHTDRRTYIHGGKNNICPPQWETYNTKTYVLGVL